MQRRLCIWMVVSSLHHIVHTRVAGLTTEIPFNSGSKVSPLLNVDVNELDIVLSFVGEPPRPPEYTKEFSSATLSTTTLIENYPVRPQTDRNPVVSIASNLQQLGHTKSGESRGGLTDNLVDHVLQAYKRFLDKASTGSIECKTDTTSLLRDLSSVWAERVVDSILHSFEPPSTRRRFAKRIVEKFLPEELVLGHGWLEHIEGVLCNCYYAVVQTVADAKRYSECKEIADDIVFAFLVEDLLTDMLSSHHEKYVADAFERLLELSAISSGKQNTWKALFSQKEHLDTNTKMHNEGKKTSKRDPLSEKSFAAALFRGAVIGNGEMSKWEQSASDTSKKANQKRSITYDYQPTDFVPFAEFRLVPLVSGSEDEITLEYFDFENNWKQTSSSPSHRPSEKSVLPATYDVTLTSTDYAELTLVARAIPEEVVKAITLKDNKTPFVHESPINGTKMLQGHKTNDGNNCSLLLNKENKENNENSYSESKWSWFFSALESLIKFFEKMMDSGKVEGGLNSDAGTLDSSSGSKFSVSEGNQHTDTAGETGSNHVTENKQISYEEAAVVMELAKEMAKMVNGSQEEEEKGWNEPGEDKRVDTQAAQGTGSAVKKTKEASILSTVTDFFRKIPQHVSNAAQFIKSKF